jgi:ABC-2 type transport system permease protein
VTATVVVPSDTLTPTDVGPVTQANVVRSEWIKFRSVRSTVLVSALTVVCVIGFGLLVSYFTKTRWDHLDPGGQLPWNVIRRSLVGVNLAQLTVGALGVVVITGEYTTGMIRATLGAVPRRLPVLWAKAGVYAAVILVLGVISSFLAFLGGQAILGSHGLSLSYPGALRAVVGVGLYLTVVGLLGLAIGFLVRSTAGGITALFGILLVLPPIVGALPTSWANTISPYLPSNAGQAIYATHHLSDTMHPWPGFLLFCGYTAGALLAAAVALRYRDA